MRNYLEKSMPKHPPTIRLRRHATGIASRMFNPTPTILHVFENNTHLPTDWENVVLPIDKPKGITSFDVVRQLRRKLGVRKIGHAGTLDPMATGLLICLIGRATKRMNEILEHEKCYAGIIRFGQTTKSFDADTPVEQETDVSALRDEHILEAAKGFSGTILQETPIYSAARMNGERLYKKARRNEIVVTPKRYVTIHELQFGSLNGRDVSFELTCSTGTYVRSIAHELGQILGIGGHLIALRRTSIGGIKASRAWQLESIPVLGQETTNK